MKRLATQEEPQTSPGAIELIAHWGEERRSAGLEFLIWATNNLDQEQLLEFSEHLRGLQAPADETIQECLRQIAWWQWAMARQYYRLTGTHMEDAEDLSQGKSETKKDAEIAYLRALCAEHVPFYSTNHPHSSE